MRLRWVMVLVTACAGHEGPDRPGGHGGGGDDDGWTSSSGSWTSSSESSVPGSGSVVPCEGAGEDCDAASEYCLESWAGEVLMAAVCAPLPDGCGYCDCVTSQDMDQVWRSLVSDTDNCDGAIVYCGQENEAIRVQCMK